MNTSTNDLEFRKAANKAALGLHLIGYSSADILNIIKNKDSKFTAARYYTIISNYRSYIRRNEMRKDLDKKLKQVIK